MISLNKNPASLIYFRISIKQIYILRKIFPRIKVKKNNFLVFFKNKNKPTEEADDNDEESVDNDG